MIFKYLRVFSISFLILISSLLHAAAKSEEAKFKGLVDNILILEKIKNTPYDLFIDCPKSEVRISLRLSKLRLFWLDKISGWPVDYNQSVRRYQSALLALGELEINEKIIFTAGAGSLHKINSCEFETISLDVVKRKKGLEIFTYISY
jgi:hypothetical protein